MRISFALGAAVAAAFGGSAVLGTVVPFTETFTSNASNWTGPAGAATWNATAGPDASGAIAADTNVNSANTGVVIALRGQGSNDASGDAFVGNWLADGVAALTFNVRHNAPTPLSIGARISMPANFPAAVGLQFAPIAPNTWGTVTIPINPAFPGFVTFEGSDFNTIFSSVGNVQLLYSVPGSLAGTGAIITLEADNVSIIPTPATCVALAAIGIAGLRRGRK